MESFLKQMPAEFGGIFIARKWTIPAVFGVAKCGGERSDGVDIRDGRIFVQNLFCSRAYIIVMVLHERYTGNKCVSNEGVINSQEHLQNDFCYT